MTATTMATEARCDSCGRTGTRGFQTIPAGTYDHPALGPIDYPGITECGGRTACRRRSWRRLPAERRAYLRWAED